MRVELYSPGRRKHQQKTASGPGVERGGFLVQIPVKIVNLKFLFADRIADSKHHTSRIPP